MAALALRRRAPEFKVTVVRSPDLGVIGVGEGTTAAFPRFLFGLLGLKPKDFYDQAQPTWKLGLRFLWGPRPEFFYTFETETAGHAPELPMENGFYAKGHEEQPLMGRISALMKAQKALPRQENGAPDLRLSHAFHIENRVFVSWLEQAARENGAEFIDGLVEGAEPGPRGIGALRLDGDRVVRGDFFVDASGFRSELAGKALGEPWESYTDSLFCDRAVIGGWDRTDETVLPYTTCETMEAGWCWRIDHEPFINRGYVFSSAFLSDDGARAELMAKNPKIGGEPRVVKFRSGRLRNLWTGNVVAVGNSGGFVEPLEATSLQTIGTMSANLADTLRGCGGLPTPSLVKLFNQHHTAMWDDIRDFLAVHYRFNTRTDSRFWRHCQSESALRGAEGIVEYYRENGPSLNGANHALSRDNAFGLEGYYALLVGQAVPHRRPHVPSDRERAYWEKRTADLAAMAAASCGVREGLALLRDPRLRWG